MKELKIVLEKEESIKLGKLICGTIDFLSENKVEHNEIEKIINVLLKRYVEVPYDYNIVQHLLFEGEIYLNNSDEKFANLKEYKEEDTLSFCVSI
ncbi:MAG: hypothetical protein ACRCXT_12655 [Paraclostridium sp.]